MDPSVTELAAARARLVAHASIVAALAVVPVPWLPELGQVVVRRRIVDDIAKRHGVSLPSSARRSLGDALAPSEGAVTGSAAKRFVAARVARRFKLLGVLPAVEAAVALAAGAFLIDRAFEKCAAAGVSMTESEAQRTQRVVSATLAAFVRPELFEEVLRQTGALDGEQTLRERVTLALRAMPAEAFDVLLSRFDHGWDSL
jgi:hypothetical protein